MFSLEKCLVTVNLSFNFGRTPLANCSTRDNDEHREAEAVADASHPRQGGGKPSRFTIGPSGGERGYAAITGRQPWGIAFYVNGILIPELVLKRGETYNFIVETGDDVENPAEYHPIYLSTDPGGGYAQKNATERAKINVIYGIENGEPVKSATGTLCEWKASSERGPDLYDTFEAYKSASLQQACTQPKRSGLFKFAPTNDTPNTIYYQCYQHRFLGWKIRVVNDWDEVDGGAGVAFQMSAALTLCIAAVTLSLVSSSSS
ncbi:PREDICTED: protein Skeletor, isoforms B/C-like [Priapulus caudatus]|uniref:Protein Skeletor, isoforms B/C-like n=1 Tax=Priapulus caudatus TaxID=37621 RepID=A0ABM1DQP3_PRICU|nr:PREDICTED: protein Skeletor, isoforms B/C-like [Priapulus caudatus]